MTQTDISPEKIERLANGDCTVERQYAATLRAQAARIAELEAAIKRQAGAAKTLRESTLAEVRHLQDIDRSEYNATKTLDSEREANAMLTEEVERLTAQAKKARNDALREAANIASNACLVPPDGGNPTKAEADVCDEAYRRILALIEGGTND